MQCSYCRKSIQSDEVTFEGLFFCNNLCKHLWQKGNSVADVNGKSAAGLRSAAPGKRAGAVEEQQTQTQQQGIFLENLDFRIDLQGMGDRKLLIRSSYFFGPRLFLNEKNIKPVKRQRLKRLRTYIVQDERGNPVEIKLKLRILDAIPLLYINGKNHEIAPKYKWYDYFMLAIPACIAYMGGFLGVLTGGAALFTNSILLRKINHKVLRYTMVNLNTAFAIFIFLKLILLAAPYITDFEFRAFTPATVSNSNSQVSPISKHVWETYKLTNLQNEDVSDRAGTQIGCKRYFFGSGKFVTVMDGGIYLEGKWKGDADSKFITISGLGDEVKAEIVSLTESEFVIRFNGLYYYQKAV